MNKVFTTICAVCVFLAFAAPASANVDIWGYQGIPISERTTPTELPGLPEAPLKVQAGYHSAYALEPNGSVYATGADSHGQLGDNGGPSTYDEWVKVSFPAGVRIKAVGIALHGGYAVDSTGQGWQWGSGHDDDSCDGKEDVMAPTKIPSLTDVTAVSGNENHVLWLTETGTVLACGENTQGQSGQGQGVAQVATPTVVPGVADAVQIAAGSEQSLVRTAAGKVFGFGSNKQGRLCDHKKTEDVFGATEIPQPGKADQVTSGEATSLFLVEGMLYGCGADTEGTIGDGATNNKHELTLASELVGHPLSDIATGGSESAGVSEGEIYTWGSALKGDLGNGQAEGFSLTPFAAMKGVEVTAVALDVLARG